LYDWIGKLTANDKALRRLSMLLHLFPRPLLYRMCRWLGLLLYRFADEGLTERIKSNMHDLLGPFPIKAIQRSTKEYFANLSVTLFELLIDSYQLKRTNKDKFQVQGEHYLQEALQQGRGAIVYTPHMGNFFYYYWFLSQRYDCMTIATASIPELQPLYLKFKEKGCKGLDYDITPPLELFRALKKHLAAGGVVYILGDFWRPSFPLSQFFGRATRTPEGAALLGIENKVPIVPFYGYRASGFTHKLVFEASIQLHEQFTSKQRKDANQLLNQFMEMAIREAPSDWFYWFNAEERWETPQGG
jgi:lauroyl/myristoyl acyltransferase